MRSVIQYNFFSAYKNVKPKRNKKTVCSCHATYAFQSERLKEIEKLEKKLETEIKRKRRVKLKKNGKNRMSDRKINNEYDFFLWRLLR